jgi:hypothetical protein
MKIGIAATAHTKFGNPNEDIGDLMASRFKPT